MNNTASTAVISIAKDFSRVPAGRYLEDGDFSGTKFRQDLLAPALRNHEHVKVVFDGVAGLGSSFLEEAFGGLVRVEHMNKKFLDEHLLLYTEEEELEDFVAMAKFYIEEASTLD